MTLHVYQKNAIRFLLNNSHSGIFADPGLGKTRIVLKLLEIYKSFKGYYPFLIVAPLRVVYSVWRQEIEKWGFNLSYNNLHEEPFKKADVYAINPESLLKTLQRFENRSQWPFTGLCIDESTRFKNPSSKRYKGLKTYLPKFQCRHILTGTPIPKSLFDIFSQVYMLDQGEALGKFHTHFRSDYFYKPAYRDYTWIPFDNSEETINRKVKPLIHRIDSSNYLDLPDLVFNDIHVYLPDDIQKLYRDIEKKFFAIWDEDPILISSAASAYNACRQIANGGLFEQLDPSLAIPKHRKVFNLHDEKGKAVKDIISEIYGKPVLIAYHYKHDLKRLQRLFPKAPYIGSGVSPKKSNAIMDRWNEGKIPVLLGHPKSIAHGLNLQKGGTNIIWYSLTDNLEDYDQFNRRIYRQGVSDKVTIHRIIMKNTIDEALIKMLDVKEKRQKSFLNAMKEYKYGRIK